MATTVRITNLLAGSSSPILATGDLLPFVDISDPTQSPQGSTVKVTIANFFGAIPVAVVMSSTLRVGGVLTVSSSGLKANAIDAGMFFDGTNIYLTDYATGTKGLKVAYATGAVSMTAGATIAGVVSKSTATQSVNSGSNTTPIAIADGVVYLVTGYSSVGGASTPYAAILACEGGSVVLTQFAGAANINVSQSSANNFAVFNTTGGTRTITTSVLRLY